MRKRTKELLDAANKLLPILKSIPKHTIRRHNLIFEDIIWDMIDEYNAQDPEINEIVGIEFIMAINLPYYIQYGQSKKTIEQTHQAIVKKLHEPKKL